MRLHSAGAARCLQGAAYPRPTFLSHAERTRSGAPVMATASDKPPLSTFQVKPRSNTSQSQSEDDDLPQVTSPAHPCCRAPRTIRTPWFYLQVHLGTGFPIPLPRYPWNKRREPSELRQHLLQLWAKRRSEEQNLEKQRVKERDDHASSAQDGQEGPDMSRWIRPVYRASPYAAEAQRAQRRTAQASILFVDEGNHCRSGPNHRAHFHCCNESIVLDIAARSWV